MEDHSRGDRRSSLPNASRLSVEKRVGKVRNGPAILLLYYGAFDNMAS